MNTTPDSDDAGVMRQKDLVEPSAGRGETSTPSAGRPVSFKKAVTYFRGFSSIIAVGIRKSPDADEV
ncbi:MAG: hypothetical protein ABII06_18540 [Pseudomonadota bacterium]